MKIIEKKTPDYALDIASDLSLSAKHINNFLDLLQEGNTIPFIARYRKEQIGSMDDEQLRKIEDDYKQKVNVQERRITIFNTLNDLEISDSELEEKINKATTLSELEDLYRPYRPKRQTRAGVAIKRGLQFLADMIKDKASDSDINQSAKEYFENQPEIEKLKKLETIEDVFLGAKDILAQEVSDNADIRNALKREYSKHGLIKTVSKVEEDTVFRLYYNYSEPYNKMANHRVLAINRGEAQDVLRVSIELDDHLWERHLVSYFKCNKQESLADKLLMEVIDDAFKRLIRPSIENELRNDLTLKAHEEALNLFSVNLRNALLVPPMKTKVVLALDPGYRNGCKWAIVDESGKVLDAGLIFPILFENRLQTAKDTVIRVIKELNVELIVLGNGTASRETELFLNDVLKENKLDVPYLMVDESGASVYSASPISSIELPQLELNLRSAVSLARRVQDPLAELVKIDPKSIGVGQYQHDMNQKRLDTLLGGVVESVVNQIGVSLNTASPSLLSYVSGVNKTIASNIVNYREQNGQFISRNELKKVKQLGAKAFEQCAGFLRIENPKEQLDNTFVHPESYKIAKTLIKNFNLKFNHPNKVNEKDLLEFGKTHEVGYETLTDIVDAISTPARDIRDDFPSPVLIREVMSIEDLKPNQVLTGVIRNVTAFGAFVDLGVHQDGLVHISQLANRFISDPTQVVQVGQVVKVRVLEVDVQKKRISLTMKDV